MGSGQTVAVFGAYGHTGRFVVSELRERGFVPVLSGRDAVRLEGLATETGMEITRVGFGSWAVAGSGWQFGWGGTDDAGSVAAIRHAVTSGVNWIDTAAAYGLSPRITAGAPVS